MARYAHIKKHVEWDYTAKVALPDDASDDPDDLDADELAQEVPTDRWFYLGGNEDCEIERISEEEDE